MNRIDRRKFVAGSAAMLTGCAGGLALAATDGRAPISRRSVEDLLRGQFDGKLTCVRTPESTDGPFSHESSPLRRAIAEGHPGRRLRLRIAVANAMMPGDTCAPLRGAIVDVWQADADGAYSNIKGDLQERDTAGQHFLRGHQITDDSGYVEFETIVPGWYLGPMPPPVNEVPRTPHIHVKVFHDHKIVTTQLYFPDRLLDALYADIAPYSAHRSLQGIPRIRNADDVVFVGDRSAPMEIEERSDTLIAAATLGVVTLGNGGYAPLFR
jgi:protocatechuate 3,4-dioxygenase beta subunit